MGVRFEPSCSYVKIHQATFKGETASAWLSSGLEDTCWDRFLQESPPGQFQQSTMWARAKKPGGWRPLRVVLTLEDEIVGGFQILRRLRWWGGIGYISKGPVIAADHPEMADYATELLRKVSRRQRLRALLVQPPDFCQQMEASLGNGGFVFGAPVDVIRSTLIFDLRDGVEAVELRIARQTRRKARQAVARGVHIREGSRQDIEAFFHLMLCSCRRQGVDPKPSEVKDLFALWDAARPSGCVRLIFAEYEGNPLAGMICITFGKTLTMWRRGWNGMEGERHPNELITCEALKLAAQNGFDFCDYMAFDEQIARAIQNGEPLSPEQERSLHCFISRFGGSPRFLPEPRMYFPNPFLQAAVMFLHTMMARRGGVSPSGVSPRTGCQAPTCPTGCAGGSSDGSPRRL